MFLLLKTSSILLFQCLKWLNILLFNEQNRQSVYCLEILVFKILELKVNYCKNDQNSSKLYLKLSYLRNYLCIYHLFIYLKPPCTTLLVPIKSSSIPPSHHCFLSKVSMWLLLLQITFPYSWTPYKWEILFILGFIEEIDQYCQL